MSRNPFEKAAMRCLLATAMGAAAVSGCFGVDHASQGDTLADMADARDGQPGDDAGLADLADGDAVVGPSAEPSSGELIAEARSSGVIDEKTAAYLDLLAQFSPDRLPQEYQAQSPLSALPSVVPMRIARAHIDEYGPTEKAAIEAMLARPDDPLWLVFPPDMEVQNAGAGAGSCRAGFSTPAAAARVVGKVADTKHYRINAVAPAGATDADKASLMKRVADGLKSLTPGVGGTAPVPFGTYLDQVYDVYATDHKMKEPKLMPAVAANGGLIPIYVAMCDGQTNDAFAEPNDGYIFVSVGIGFEDATLRRVVLPHEVFHIFQDAYDVPAVSRDLGWVNDAAAVAAEDLVAPDVRRWSGSLASSPNLPPGFGNAMARSFQCPEEPLHTDYSGKCKYRAPGAKQYDGAYSKFVVFKFMMRNYNLVMGEFWEKLKAAGGDPRDLFDDQNMGELQLALMGDVGGKNPYFDPGDRAAFQGSGASAVDLAPSDPERYTYKMNPAAYGQSVAYRITPSMDSSQSKTLNRLDNSSQPIQPGGTQRILLEVPEDVASREPGSCGSVWAFESYIEFSNCSECTVNRAEVLKSGGGPGISLDETDDDADTLSAPWAYPYAEWTVDEGDPIPGFILYVVTNHGSSAATFKGGLTVQQACTGACMEEYGKIIDGLQCPEFWCSDPCVDAGTCAEWYQNCLDSYREDLESKPGTFCLYVCTGNGHPYPEEASPECFRWQESTCKVSGVADCKTIPSDFVPIPTWPTARCQTFMVSDDEQCQ